jgi:hypothetical protein
MWPLWMVASRTGRSPSEVLGIACTWCAYCVDEAVLIRVREAEIPEEAEAEREEEENELQARRARVGGRT